MNRLLLSLCLLFPILAYAVSPRLSTRLASEFPLQASFDSLVNAAVAESRIPGAVVCVVDADHVAFLRAYGYRQVYPDTLPMTEDTQFDLASLSKIVGTGMSLMSLVDKGLVQLTDTFNGVTLVDYLTHTSGLPAYTTWSSVLRNLPDSLRRVAESSQEASLAVRKQALYDYIAQVKRKSAPGTDCVYSCLNFISLQYVIERTTGMSLAEYAKKSVFRPLGMKHTTYYPLSPSALNRHQSGTAPCRQLVVAPTERIAPYDASASPQPLLMASGAYDAPCYQAIVHDPLAREMNGGVSGNAGVFSTASDLARLAIWVLNPDTYRGPFSAETLRLMMTVPAGYEAFGRALAWDQSSDYAGCKGSCASPSAVCHTGYTGTSIVVDPEKRLALIVLTNRAHPSDGGGVSALRRKLADLLFFGHVM